MKPSINCYNLIKKWEGFREEAYLCPAGVWTIGYGTTAGVKKGDVITEVEASKRLTNDVNGFSIGVAKAIKVDVSQNQFDALVSFTYNVGLGAFSKSTLLRKLNAGDYEGAANEFKRWNKAGGKVLKGLTNRRMDEEQLFRSGDA